MAIKMMTMVSSWALAVAACAADLPPAVKLMFGPPTAPKEQREFAGFRYVAADDAMFAKGKSSKMYGWAYIANGGFSGGSTGSLPADTLLEHGIRADREVTLSVPFAKDGPVKVHVWVGDWFLGWRRMYGKDQEIWIRHGGRKVFEETMSPETSYRNWCKLEEYSFSKKDPIWDRIVAPILTDVEFDAVAKDGKVVLELRNVLLTALAVTSTAAEMKTLLAETEQARREMFAKRYPWKPQPDEPLPDNVDPKADCVLFQRSGMDNVKPWSRPKAGEVTDTVRIFAAQGEQEPFRFGVLPLKDFGTLEVEVGDFRGPGGATLKTAEVADFWRERYKERGSEGTRGKIDQLWRLDPLSYVLQKNGPQNGEAGTPRMYDLDMFVPEDAAPGDYFADLAVKGDGRVIRRGRLQLKVLPFKLRYEGAAQYGFQSGYGNGAMYGPGHTQEQTDAGVKTICDMINRYRFFCISLTAWGYGLPGFHKFGRITGEPGARRLEIDAEHEKSWDWWMNMINPDGKRQRYLLIQGWFLFLNMGWRMDVSHDWQRVKDPTWFTPERQKGFELELKDGARLARQVTDFMKRKGYPEPYWYMCGEIDNYGAPGAEACCRWGDALREVGCASLVTINGPLAYKMTPAKFDHVWANPATPVDEGLKAAVEKAGHRFGTHNSGDTRFQAGFQFWRTGSEGRYQETQFYTDFMRPFCLLPWNYNTAQAYPAPDGSYRPTIPWLNYRDGRDDYLYLYTLEQALKDGKGSPEARTKAEKFLAFMRKKVKFDPRAYHAAHFDGIEATVETMTDVWNGVSIERYRWRIADLISKLEEGKR